MKTSDQGRSPSTTGSMSGQKACGAPGDLESISGHASVLGALSEEPESLLPTSGLLNSPNYPAYYPNDLHERKTIQVAKGNIINIHFTDFEVDDKDYLEITDGDGSWLGHFGEDHYMKNGKGGERMVFPLKGRDQLHLSIGNKAI